MVSASVIIAVCVTLSVSLLLPVVLLLVYGLRNRKKGIGTAWLLGAAGFLLFQVTLRIPILNLLSGSEVFLSFAAGHYLLYCLLLAVSAALFEAGGRYMAAKLIGKKPTFERGVAAGLGHGGIEAMVLIGMTYVNNLAYILMINTGAFDGLVEQMAQMGVDTGSLLAVRATLVSSGPLAFYLAGYERVLTMVFHTALSLLMCYFVWRGKALKGILLCVLFHGAADFIAPVANGLATPYLGNRISTGQAYILAYAFLTAAAAASVAGILYIRRHWEVPG